MITPAISARRRALLFALALVAGILNLADRQVMAVLKPTIAAELGWTDNDYGALTAWFQAGAAAGLLVAGWIVDRLGVKWANPLGVAAWSLAAMAHGAVREMTGLIAARVALGATEAMGTPASVKTIAAIFTGQQRARGFGLSNAMNSLGAILAPLGIPFLAVWCGWRTTFAVLGLAGLGWAGLWVLATHGVALDQPDHDRRASADPPGGEPDGPHARQTRQTAHIALAKVLSDATWWLLLFWMPDYFHRQFGLAGTALALPLAGAYLGAAAGSLAAGQISAVLARRGHHAMAVRQRVMLASALCVLPVPLALVAPTPGAAAAIMALALAGHQGFSTSLFALIADVTPAARIGRVTGTVAFFGNLGGAAISRISGWVLAAGLGYAPLFGFAAIAYFLALIVLQPVIARHGRHPRAAPGPAPAATAINAAGVDR